jgi:hypothetical protein
VGSASMPDTVGEALCVSAREADETRAGTEITVAIR